MLIGHDGIVQLINQGAVKNCRPGCVNAASLDVHLGPVVLRERKYPVVVDLAARTGIGYKDEIIDKDSGYLLAPSEFVLAATEEFFCLPGNIAAMFVLKSSMARSGLNQMNATWCNPGWKDSTLTLELQNSTRYHSLRLRSGMAIGQMVFFEVSGVPREKLYSEIGSFNGLERAATAAEGTKPLF